MVLTTSCKQISTKTEAAKTIHLTDLTVLTTAKHKIEEENVRDDKEHPSIEKLLPIS